MNDIEELTNRIVSFCEKRDWAQFHSPKDLSISLSLEASEVLEHFQWKSEQEIKDYVDKNKSEIGEELADVFYWVLIMSYYLEIDLKQAFNEKMDKNENKYPADKVKGKHHKYTEYK